MEKGRTGINIKSEAQILSYRDQERQARQRAQLHWYPYVSPFQQQLRDIWDALEFNKSIGRFDGMLADIANSKSGELVKIARQVILTYAEIWSKDIQSGFCTNYPSFDFFAQMKEMKVQLGVVEFEKQRGEVSDWYSEMRQRVRGRFVEVLGEIMMNSRIPSLVQEKAKEIHSKLIH